MTDIDLSPIAPIIDPDIDVSIVDLGLIRRVKLSEDRRRVDVVMTLTSPGCPIAPEMMAAVDAQVRGLPGVEEVTVELEWSPPWDPHQASEEARWEMGIYD